MSVDFPPPPRAPDTRADPRTGDRNWRDFDRWVVLLREYLNRLVEILLDAGADVLAAADRLDSVENEIAALQAADETHVIGAPGATDGALARYDGGSGKRLKNSSATVDDSGNLNAATYAVAGTQVLGAQGAAISDVPTGGSATAADNATAINLILARMRTHGVIAT